jgi:hypothetical protein
LRANTGQSLDLAAALGQVLGTNKVTVKLLEGAECEDG